MSSPYQRFTIIAVVVALALVLALSLWLGLHWYIAWLIGWSIVTFVFYGLDKQWARSNSGRIPELVLHGMALAGGFAGGWAGRAIFRHKTRDASFTIVLTVATALHATFAAWLYLA